MNLKEIKQLTDNLSNLDKWRGLLQNLSFNDLKSIKSSTISKLPKEFQYHLILEKFRKVHKNRYNYSQFTLDWFISNYKDKNTKVPIVCPTHGLFYQSVTNHQLYGCPKCGKNTLKMSYKEFIDRTNKIHNNKYIYPFDENWWQENYKTLQSTYIPIVCSIHGEFKQKIAKHLQGRGCPKCGRKKSEDFKRLSYEEFINKATKIHNDFYIYPIDANWWQENYKNNSTQIPIICPIHGLFYQSVESHLQGRGCLKCGREKLENNHRLSYQDFIKSAIQTHGDRYTYPSLDWWQSNYQNNKQKIPIVCPQHELFYQRIDNHLNNHGCPKCNTSKGELFIQSILDELGVNYIHQYRVKINDSNYYFDFYLPDYNTFIEYDGKQHFEPVDNWGGKIGFEKIKQRDKIKDTFAKDNKIKLIRIPYYKTDEEIKKTIIDLVKSEIGANNG